MSIYRKQMGALVIGQFSSLLLSFLVPMILAHLLTNENFGLYAQFNLITAFCMSFFSFGISSELYFFYPKVQVDKKRVLINQSFIFLVFLSILTFLLFLFPPFRRLLITSEALEDKFWYLILAILFSIPTVIITTLYVLNHDNKTSALYLPLSTLSRVLMIFLFYSFNPTIESIFLGLLVNYGLLFLFVVYYVSKELKKNKGDSDSLVDISLFKKQVSYAMPLGIANSARVFAQQIDKLILLSYVSPALYAIYSIASYGVPGLNQLYLSISQVYIPRMAKAVFDSDTELVKHLYKSMVLKTLCYTIPIVLVVCLFAPVIVPFLFSAKYLASIPYFQIYLFTFIFSAMGNGVVLRATGETRKSLFAFLYSLIFIIPITFFSIKYYKLNGAIISAFFSSILPRFFLTKYDLSALGCTLREIFPWNSIAKISMISVLLLMPFIFLIKFLNVGILLAVICIMCYLISVFLVEMHYGVFLLSKKDAIVYIKKKVGLINN